MNPQPEGEAMSPLKLRQEFLSRHMRATAIELCNKQNTGWAQRKNANELLDITYPTADIQRSLEAISTSSASRPVLFIGQRGRGKRLPSTDARRWKVAP